MPLAFDSISHGTIAFGFFNIESDMLLLQRHFFFSTHFCDCISRLARQSGASPAETLMPGFTIEDPERVGDLMGAIHGIRFAGFIGEMYRRFPFPDHPDDFRQNPEGHRTQSLVAEMIGGYGNTEKIPVAVHPAAGEVTIGEFRFSRNGFRELIRYVWVGGYPRWKGEILPDCVTAMADDLSACRTGLLGGLAPGP